MFCEFLNNGTLANAPRSFNEKCGTTVGLALPVNELIVDFSLNLS